MNVKLNQKVWSSEFGYGIIIQLNNEDEDEYPIKVQFSRNLIESYDLKGFRNIFSKYQTLFLKKQNWEK